jgi:hypothetical protein
MLTEKGTHRLGARLAQIVNLASNCRNGGKRLGQAAM